MLNDPLFVPILTQSYHASYANALNELAAAFITSPGFDQLTLHAVPTTDGSGKRKGVLSDGTKVLMTTSHSTSKENAPYVTDRTLIRLDFSRVDGVTGKPVTASVYVVIALPQGGTFTTNDASLFTESLALFLVQGGRRDGASSPLWGDAVDGDTARRLIDGEA